MDPQDRSSRDSSPLSELSVSPPPVEFPSRNPYPSPSSSRRSSDTETTPSPDSGDNITVFTRPSTPTTNGDGAPPRKRRKLSEPMSRKTSESVPRTTQYLNLRESVIPESQKPQLEQLLNVLHKKRKIVVVAGAGISVAAGIPDFRSSTGLFKALRAQHNLKSSGKDLFDASVYQDDSSTSTFHEMVRSLSEKTKSAKPTLFHHLLATLAQEGRLLRLYTQNIDGIDTALPPLATEVPLGKKAPWPKTIQLHGGLDTMVCSKCHALSKFEADKFNGPIPPACSACETLDHVRTQHAGKRSHGIGRLRPRMVLYNEHNPDGEAIGCVTKADLRTRPDALIVVGTTLKVPGVKRIVREMCGVVRDRKGGVTVWLNNDPAPVGKEFENCWDLVVTGPCDEVARLAAMRKWDEPAVAEVVSDEIVAKVKQENGLKEVLVPTPTKDRFSKVTEFLHTPSASPHPEKKAMFQASPTNEPETPSKKRKGAAGKQQGKVKTIGELLGPSSQGAKAPVAVGTKAPRKRAPAKKLAGPKANAKITNAFGVSKSSKEVRGKGKHVTDAKSAFSSEQDHTNYTSVPMGQLSPREVRNNANPFTVVAGDSVALVKAEGGGNRKWRNGTVSPKITTSSLINVLDMTGATGP